MANRLLTINIRNYLADQPRRKRPWRISRFVRERIAQQTNIRLSNVKISKELNELIQKKYLYKMTPLKMNINIEKEMATATPFEAKAVKKEEAAKPAAKVAEKTSKKEAEPQSKRAENKEVKK